MPFPEYSRIDILVEFGLDGYKVHVFYVDILRLAARLLLAVCVLASLGHNRRSKLEIVRRHDVADFFTNPDVKRHKG